MRRSYTYLKWDPLISALKRSMMILKIDNNKSQISVIDVRKDELPDIKFCKGVIVTGSHDMVTDNHPWSVKVEKWIPKLF